MRFIGTAMSSAFDARVPLRADRLEGLQGPDGDRESSFELGSREIRHPSLSRLPGGAARAQTKSMRHRSLRHHATDIHASGFELFETYPSSTLHYERSCAAEDNISDADTASDVGPHIFEGQDAHTKSDGQKRIYRRAHRQTEIG